MCRFSDAGMTGSSTRRGGRRPKSAKAGATAARHGGRFLGSTCRAGREARWPFLTLSRLRLCAAAAAKWLVPEGATPESERFGEPTCPIGSGRIGTPQQGQTKDLHSGSQLDRLAVRRVPVGFGPSFLAGFQGRAIRQTLGRESGDCSRGQAASMRCGVRTIQRDRDRQASRAGGKFTPRTGRDGVLASHRARIGHVTAFRYRPIMKNATINAR